MRFYFVFLLAFLVSTSMCHSYYNIPCTQNGNGGGNNFVDCYDVCDSYCTGFYATSGYNTYNSGDYTYADCYCQLSGWGLSVVIILPSLFLCWCCIAAIVSCAICNTSMTGRLSKSTVLTKDENSYVIYSAAPSCFSHFIAVLLSTISCGICLPFIVVKQLQDYFSRFWFAGEQGRFQGNPFDYCLNVFCVNSCFTCFTCGLWALCGFASDKTNKWIDDNTVAASTGRNNGIYLFQARPKWYKILFERFISCITCGVATPLFFVRHLKETVSQMRFASKSAEFVGDTDDYVSSTWAPTFGLNILSCGLFSFCGLADVRRRNYTDQHIAVPSSSPASPSGSLGTLPVTAVPVSSSQNNGYNSLSATPPQYHAPLMDDEYKPTYQPASSYGTYQTPL